MKTWKVVLISMALAIPALAITAEALGKVDFFAETNPAQFVKGVYIGPRVGVNRPQANVQNKVTRSLGGSATIDFASTTAGRVFSSSIAVVGARAGDPCMVGVPTAAAALPAKYGCLVDAADSVKIWFSPIDETMGQVALTSASPSTATATVSAGSICVCTPVGGSAAIAAAGCATGVSSTTLTLTGPNTVTTTMTYDCKAPVDPASGTYYVRVASSQ